MLHGEKTKTTGGNMRAPEMNIYLEWIVKAWESLSMKAITNSFKTCGITNALDGSEDDKIHCFKSHGPVSTGFALLQKARTENQLEIIMQNLEECNVEEENENECLSDDSLLFENLS